MAQWFAAFRLRGALKPCDDDGREALSNLSPGTPVMVQVKQGRNVQQHRLFFALLTLVHHNLPECLAAKYPTVQALRENVQFACGLFEVCVAFDGTKYYKAKSIAFDAMEQSEFGKFFRSAVDVLTEFVLVDVDNQELMMEVEKMLQKAPQPQEKDDE